MVNEAVFAMLVTKGNKTAGTGSPWDLAPGQIGFFNPITNAAITTKADADRYGFYIAVGVDKDGDGSTDTMRRSFREIYPKNFVDYTQKCYTPYQDKIIDFSGCTINYSTTYILKLRFFNPSYFRSISPTGEQYKYLNYETEKQVDTSSTDPDIAKMYQSFLDQFNADEFMSSFMELALLNPSDNAAITDLPAWCTSNPGVAPKMRFTVHQFKDESEMDEFYNFSSPIEMSVDLFPSAGFINNGTITVVQEMAYEEITGSVVQQYERIAGGYIGNPGPIRELNAGLLKTDYLADYNTKYSTIVLHYKLDSSDRLQTDILTYIAVPADEGDTFKSIRENLGLLLTGNADGLATVNCGTVSA